MQKLNASEFMSLTDSHPVIDVRSPVEFNRGHIPGAFNIPLFSDREREIIGTSYKRKGRETAIQEGLDFVGPKLSRFVAESRALARNGRCLVHCWRGGMRSESFSWLLTTAGLQCSVLDGGYKSFRQHMRATLSQPLQLALITGSTGTGKTQLLRTLQQKGEQVIDLESIANHKGSVFGGLGLEAQPTTEQFQNNLFEAVRKLDPSRPVWLEDESIGIGEVHIPDEFWIQMCKAPIIALELHKKARIDRLVNEYGLSSISDIEACILKITKRLGDQQTRIALEALEQGNLAVTAEILLGYYDKAYNNSLERRNHKIIETLSYDHFEQAAMTDNLIKTLTQWKKPQLVNG